MRISGVSVGKVKTIDLADAGLRRRDDRARRGLRADPRRHAGDPAPEDAARRDLRRAHPRAATTAQPLPEGGSLPPAQVSDAVQLDEIFRTFDEPTRAAFQAWMQGQAASLRGRGDDLSVAIASLAPFADDSRPAAAPARQPGRRPEPVRPRRRARPSRRSPSARASSAGLIENAPQVFKTTAERNAGSRRHLPDLPDLPARVARDAYPPRAVRSRHRPGGLRPAAGCARARADPGRDPAPRAGAGLVLQRPAGDARGRAEGPQGDPGAARLSAAAAAQGLRPLARRASTRSSRSSACTSARSPRLSRTSPRPATASSSTRPWASRSTTSARRLRWLRRRSRPIRTGCRSPAPTRTSSPGASPTSAPG